MHYDVLWFIECHVLIHVPFVHESQLLFDLFGVVFSSVFIHYFTSWHWWEERGVGKKWGLNLTGTCTNDRVLVLDVSLVQVSVQRLTRAMQRARALESYCSGVLTRRGKKKFSISITGWKKCCLGFQDNLDDNGIIFLRSRQLCPVVDFTVLEFDWCALTFLPVISSSGLAYTLLHFFFSHWNMSTFYRFNSATCFVIKKLEPWNSFEMKNSTFGGIFLLVRGSCLISRLTSLLSVSVEKHTTLPRAGAGAGAEAAAGLSGAPVPRAGGQEVDQQSGPGDRPVCGWTGHPVQLCSGDEENGDDDDEWPGTSIGHWGLAIIMFTTVRSCVFPAARSLAPAAVPGAETDRPHGSVRGSACSTPLPLLHCWQRFWRLGLWWSFDRKRRATAGVGKAG